MSSCAANSHFVIPSTNFHTRCTFLDYKDTHTFGLFGLICHGEDREEICVRTVGNKVLYTIQYILVTVKY
ncbi:MAG: hypothetical protein Q7I98_08070, partial [Erysipelotrichaceae bacterium]|nr:hypothetical protein [Erysipelotrichaceae bacterium]